mmetsp:Transcript_24526/g.44360  ORF Transcript_24526/g.44360 Transcript_24526/m.44360 type:complete len:213 (-) Transcript_24526:2652-3290(-)
MSPAHSSCGSSTHGTAYVTSAAFVIINDTGGSHDPRVHICIRPHILGFLLGPDNFGIFETLLILGNPIKCKRSDLLQPNKCNILPLALLTFGQEFIIDLTRTKHKGLDVVGILANGWVSLVNDALKGSVGSHLLEGRDTSLVSQQVFGRHYNERLAEITVHLTAQTVEKIGRGRTIDNLPIALLDLHPLIPGQIGNVMRIFIHHLQESFHST